MSKITRHRCLCLECEIESITEPRIRPFLDEGWDIPPRGPTLHDPEPITEHAGLCPVCNPNCETDATSEADDDSGDAGDDSGATRVPSLTPNNGGLAAVYDHGGFP